MSAECNCNFVRLDNNVRQAAPFMFDLYELKINNSDCTNDTTHTCKILGAAGVAYLTVWPNSQTLSTMVSCLLAVPVMWFRPPSR